MMKKMMLMTRLSHQQQHQQQLERCEMSLPTIDAGTLDVMVNSGDAVVLLTPTSSHCLVSWMNPVFCKQFGWSFGEVIGREIFFMHGDAASMIPLAKCFHEAEATLRPLNGIQQKLYTQEGVLVECNITLCPLLDPSVQSPKSQLAFLAVIINDVRCCGFPPELLHPFPKLFEVGLPIDRREYCKHYSDFYGKPSDRNRIFDGSHLKQFCQKANFTNIMSLMMASPDSLLICNR
jgi:hypothetical protein